jgi:hypothetical protein
MQTVAPSTPSIDIETFQEFREAAKPLVEFLATLPCSHHFHHEVLADIYDLVNEIRDEEVEKARVMLIDLRTSRDFPYNPTKKSRAVELQGIIHHYQGV